MGAKVCKPPRRSKGACDCKSKDDADVRAARPCDLSSEAQSGGSRHSIGSVTVAVDETHVLPSELWDVILRSTVLAAHERFVAARVCRQWRVLVLSCNDVKGRQIRTGAAVCRQRIASDAIHRDASPLSKWALVEVLANPVTNDAAYLLWSLAASEGAVECARAMHNALPWPPRCNLSGCHCAEKCSDGELRRRSLDYWMNDECPTLGLMTQAACHRRYEMMALFFAWKAQHPIRYMRALAVKCVVSRRTDVIDALLGGRLGQPVAADMRVVLDRWIWSWVDLAACRNQVDALEWLHKHDDRGGRFDGALDSAAVVGATKAVEWLCEHQYVGRFVDAVLCAVQEGHTHTQDCLIKHVKLARLHYEAKGLTLQQAARELLERCGSHRPPKKVVARFYACLE